MAAKPKADGRLPIPPGKYPRVPPGTEKIGGKWFFPAGWQPHHVALWLFGIRHPGHQKFLAFKELVGLLWPDPIFVWDEWSDLFFGALCGDLETIEATIGRKLTPPHDQWWRTVTATGAASTGKSSKAALWALCCWLYAQSHTAVVLTSTSLDQLKRRIWAELCDWIGKCREKLPLEVIPSETEIRFSKSDKRHAIFGIAVKSGGQPQEAVDRIKGIHTRNIAVVVDEMTSVPQAISVACRNLNKGTTEFCLIGLGNALSREDQHGQYSEPVDGFESITVEDQFWFTKLGGCGLHFDGHRSPAIRDPQKFFFYINKEQMESDEKFYGGQNTPQYWTNDRGFWPPTGLTKTVMDEAFLLQFDVSGPAVWDRGFQMGAGLDPSFEGGDRRILYPFKFGKFTSGVTGLEFCSPILVTVDVSEDKRWIHYQIADNVQRECEQARDEWGGQKIKPEHLCMDVTGEGGGLYAIMTARWSPLIKAVEFGGAAEKTRVVAARPATWYELYGNRVTMIWYLCRAYAEGGQIRGLVDHETRQELTTREYETKNGKIVIESKKKMKLRGLRSPDKADAACVGTWLLHQLGIPPSGSTASGGVSMDDWNKTASQMDRGDERSYQDAEAAFV